MRSADPTVHLCHSRAKGESATCQQQHVALLSVGQKRTVEVPEVAASLRRMRSSILEQGHLVTTLMFISCEAAERAGLRSRLLKTYNASEVWLLSEELTPCLAACKIVSCNHSADKINEKNSLLNWFRQFGKVRAAWQHALRYEAQDPGRRFTWFLKIRPDLVFFEPLPSLCTLHARSHSALVPRGVMTSVAKYQLYNDHVILCPRSLCEPYFSVVSQYETCGRTGAMSQFDPAQPPQQTLVNAFHDAFGPTSLRLFDLAYTIARSSGPDCQRLECRSKTPQATGCVAPHLQRFVTGCHELARKWASNAQRRVIVAQSGAVLSSLTQTPQPNTLLTLTYTRTQKRINQYRSLIISPHVVCCTRG